MDVSKESSIQTLYTLISMVGNPAFLALTFSQHLGGQGKSIAALGELLKAAEERNGCVFVCVCACVCV